MNDVFANLSPRSVWGHFAALAAIPRPSGHEERAVAFVTAVGESMGVAPTRDARGRLARITATAEARWTTGVEMEALVAVAAAALALYDMAKGVDRAIAIEEIVLVEKSGGRSGTWRRGGPRP